MDIRVTAALAGVAAADWNRLAGDAYPFLRHEFLGALEEFDCLAPQGWKPVHLLAYAGDRLAGALPLYLKSNSIGEFVFDWSWADAYERAGGRYYPKLVSAIPFVPATGPRLLVAPDAGDPGAVRDALVDAAVHLGEQMQLSSLHCLFPSEVDRVVLGRHGLLLRMGCQYHWHNEGYADFDDFLGALTSKRRKQIRRERREVSAAGIEFEILPGDAIDARQWRTFYEFYCSTFHRRWGEPRLTLAFFQALGRRLPAETLLFLARERGGDYVAGAFALRGADTLYGRHWGCSAQVPFLHFELCYYRTIEYCIEQGLARLDAGAQGEHKIARGFRPVRTWSAHWLRDDGFRSAVADFLDRETRMIDAYVADLDSHSPYRDSG
ncbi:MAG: N-acetyltransferase [Gammaproteobacteria bacterium]|nr:N-acetyltransferase [Gammaproteobacteria bacterium]